MTTTKSAFWIALLTGLVLASCAPAPAKTAAMSQNEAAMASTVTPDAMMEKTPDDSMMATSPADPSMENTPEATEVMTEVPGWFSVELTNAANGETFQVADLQGKVVLVETMAQWCTNCMKQQREVIRLHDILGEQDDFISLGMDIDPNEDLATLKTYIERNEFSWTYTVAPAEVSNELASLYGNQFLNPPSTPMLIIDRKGGVHPLPFGIKTAEDLQKALEPFLSDSM